MPTVEQSPITKISQQDLETAIKDVAIKTEEQRRSLGQLEVKLSPTADDYVEAVNATTLHRLRNHPNKARQALRFLVDKAALATASLMLLSTSVLGAYAASVYGKEPSSIELSQDIGSMDLQNGGKLLYDTKEDIPLRYVFPNGKQVNFDKVEMERLKGKATASGEPEIITVIPYGQKEKPSKFRHTPEHPQTLNLPKDVLTTEELEKRGITIIQPPKNPDYPNPVNLYIRKGAFEEGAPLADFNNTGRKLTIALVDAPFLAQRFLQDPRYDNVKDILHPEDPKQIIEDYKQDLLASVRREEGRKRMFQYSYAVAALGALNKGMLTDKDILKLDGSSLMGKYAIGLGFSKEGKAEIRKPAVILVCTDQQISKELEAVFFQPSGSIFREHFSISSILRMKSRVNPNPQGFFAFH